MNQLFAQADGMNLPPLFVLIGLIVAAVLFIPFIISRFLTTVDAGTIRLVSWFGGKTNTFRGPGKAVEIPVLTTATTIPSKAINIDLDIADQTADVDEQGRTKPIKVRVLASAIVSIGDTNEMIKTAANKFFSKGEVEQNSILVDLLSSTGRRAINLLHHDELFNRSAATRAANMPASIDHTLATSEDDDRLAIIIKSACSRELQDLGLVFNSLNIKDVQSEVAEARRRQTALEAKANADIVQADQERRSREAQLTAEQAISDRTRDLEQRRAENAVVVAEAEAKRQTALATQREAELLATQIASAKADAEQMIVAASAAADAEALKIRRIAEAQAEGIRKVNEAMREGGEQYLALKQLEMLPTIAPEIARALGQAKLINISGGGNAPGETANQITQVIQTILAAKLFAGPLDGVVEGPKPANERKQIESEATPASTPAPKKSGPPPLPGK
ncbi:MAG: hypothetical protein JNK63_03420 [Chthonomonas sp.]|nr:hypothetical protein [Chthonomonas sp.]